MELKEILSKSILVASFMSRYVEKEIDDWGNFVFVKKNAPELLQKDLKRFKNFGEGKIILFSSVTDPYQGVENKYQLTRKCLEVLLDFGFLGEVSILTKSSLIIRDIDLFAKFKHISVGLTITSVDDEISKFFEKFAPKVSERFLALEKLNSAEIDTYAFFGPILPHFASSPEKMEEVFMRLSKVGTKKLYIEHINLSNYIRNRLFAETNFSQEILKTFYESKTKNYRSKIDKFLVDLVKKYDMKILGGGKAIYHKDFNN